MKKYVRDGIREPILSVMRGGRVNNSQDYGLKKVCAYKAT